MIVVVTPEEILSNVMPPMPTPAGFCTDPKFINDYIVEFMLTGQHTLILPTDPTGHDNGQWDTRGTPDLRTVHYGYRDAGDDPIIHAGRPAQDVLSDLSRWRHTMGTHYRITPGVAALAAFGERFRGYARTKLQHQATAEWWQPPGSIADLNWNPKTASSRSLHRWDMRSAYLAAAAAVDLPTGQLRHTGPDWDTDTVGYYRVRSMPMFLDLPWFHHVMPNPDRQGCMWVCHPTLSFLSRYGSVEVVDSYTRGLPAGAHRHLRAWAETIRDGIYDHPGSNTAKLLKQGYAQAIGLMAVARGSIYRPDWRHMIIDQVRASMLRRIASVHQLTGLEPARVNVDSVWYQTDNPDQVGAALGVGDLIGRMRYEGTH